MTLKTVALIVAGGDARRFGGETPKPYLPLAGKTVVRRAIDAFASHPEVDSVRVVIRRVDHPLYRKASQGLTIFPCVVGGASRQDSVRRGLESLARHNPQNVLIHDAARPLVSHALISRVLEGLERAPAALPALPVADTLRTAGGGIVPRESLLAAQTPQGFHFEAILDAHRRLAGRELTDDIALAEAAGLQVEVVAGDRANFKLTTPDDLPLMQQLATAPGMFETRVGTGFDVHPFAAHEADGAADTRGIMVCGVHIPHDQKLKGHSDADVGLHALVDALLGAIGEGDIGQHFPPSDAKWKGADSARFLTHALELVRARGGAIVNVDLTIMGEQPRISPYRTEMAKRIATLLELDITRVNVKATTTEKLGFLGRGEGLAAQAVAAVRLPGAA